MGRDLDEMESLERTGICRGLQMQNFEVIDVNLRNWNLPDEVLIFNTLLTTGEYNTTTVGWGKIQNEVTETHLDNDESKLKWATESRQLSSKHDWADEEQ
ncbi:hypothetical protein J6590_017653 [Homalodisca vitripennis]|nr:hypothetical protein J6590_017653 [Homalodisca vitripennis]